MDSPDSTPKREKPAITIQVHSWATPIVGLLMLLAGLTLGYFGRPWLQSLSAVPQQPPAVQNPPAQSTTTTSNPELMEFVVSQTRHFKGEPGAPVTIIEFSDYQ